MPGMRRKEHFGAWSGTVAATVTKAHRDTFGLPSLPGPSPGQPQVDDLWLEIDFAPGWRAAYRFVPYAGQPVVAELRIFPADEFPGRRTGTWRAEFLGVRSAPGVMAAEFRCPPVRRGITARLKNKAPLGVQLKHAAAFLREIEASKWGQPGSFGLIDGATHWPAGPAFKAPMGGVAKAGARRGRPGRSDRYYAALARDYVARCDTGSRRPVADVAARRGLDPSLVRDAIHEARRRGLLSEGMKGTPGGSLTPQGRRILEAKRKGNR